MCDCNSLSDRSVAHNMADRIRQLNDELILTVKKAKELGIRVQFLMKTQGDFIFHDPATIDRIWMDTKRIDL